MTSPSPGPRVSVFMSVYNGMPHLQDCVDSVMAQTTADFEFLIVDDGSTDGTAAYLDALDDDRIRVFHKPNEGLGEPLNPWLHKCRGQYIMRVDADDVCVPERMAAQACFLDSHPDVVVVGSQFVPFTDDGDGNPTRLVLDHDAILGGMMRGWHTLSHATTMWRRSILDEVDGYSFTGPGEDWSFILDAASHGRLANVPEVLYRVRLHDSSASWRGSRDVLKGFAYAQARYHSISTTGSPVELERFEKSWEGRSRFTRAEDHLRALSGVLWRQAVVHTIAGRRVRGFTELVLAALLDPRKSVGALRKRLAS